SDFLDGIGEAVEMRLPKNLCLSDDEKTLFVTDGSCVREIQLETAKVKTLTGVDDTYGYQDGSSAEFNFPQGIVYDRRGFLIVADGDNNCLRLVHLNATNGTQKSV